MSDYKNIRTKEKLEKCPFCGSEAAIYDSVDFGNVCCSKAFPYKEGVPCSEHIFPYVKSISCSKICFVNDNGGLITNQEDAIKDWNYYARLYNRPKFDSKSVYEICGWERVRR